MKKIWKREEIPVEHTWTLEGLYPNDEAWEKDLATLEADKAAFASFAGRLTESAETMLEYFTLVEQVSMKISALLILFLLMV